MIAVAGLDLSLRSAGVGILNEDGSAACYTFGYGLSKECTERDKIERIIFISNQVMGVLFKHNVKFVGFENYGFAGNNLTLQADLGGTLKTQVYIGIKSVPVLLPAMSVRKYLLGKATKDKKVVRRYLSDRGYSEPSNLDESDALAVALVVNDWANKTHEIVDVHKMEVLDRINRNQSSKVKRTVEAV
jgi:Holliday junction resolvasome RuvABC endonuclease subunit